MMIPQSVRKGKGGSVADDAKSTYAFVDDIPNVEKSPSLTREKRRACWACGLEGYHAGRLLVCRGCGRICEKCKCVRGEG